MELPSATDREGREIARDYHRRKTVQLALDVAKEYRMATAKRDPQPTLQDWMVEVSLPPHHLWGVEKEADPTQEAIERAIASGVSQVRVEQPDGSSVVVYEKEVLA